MQISSNGLISLGTSSFTSYVPRYFPINVPVIAPYWDDTDLRKKGNIYYSSFSNANDSGVLNSISTFINSFQNTTIAFEATSAVIIFWSDVCSYTNPNCIEVSLA